MAATASSIQADPALRRVTGRHAWAPPRPAAPAPQPALLAYMRLAMLRCRAQARVDPRACALLDPAADPADVALRLAQLLPLAMRRRPVLLAPGAAGRSFDEAWLLALAAAAGRDDVDSMLFLLRRRVRPEAARPVLATLRALLARL